MDGISHVTFLVRDLGRMATFLCEGPGAGYPSLRAFVLGSPDGRAPSPHVTLAHPRHPRAPGNGADAACRLPSHRLVRFDSPSLVGPAGYSAWRALWTLPQGSESWRGRREQE